MEIVREAVKKSKFVSYEEDFVDYITLKKVDALNHKDIDLLITQFWNHQHADLRWKVYNFIMENYNSLSEEDRKYLINICEKDGSTLNLKDMGCSFMESACYLS